MELKRRPFIAACNFGNLLHTALKLELKTGPLQATSLFINDIVRIFALPFVWVGCLYGIQWVWLHSNSLILPICTDRFHSLYIFNQAANILLEKKRKKKKKKQRLVNLIGIL